MRTRSHTPVLAKLLVAGSGIMSLANSLQPRLPERLLRRLLSTLAIALAVLYTVQSVT